MSILHLVEVSQNMSSYSAVLNPIKHVCRIKRNESKLPKMSKEYRNEFRKDTIGENVSQGNFLKNDFQVDGDQMALPNCIVRCLADFTYSGYVFSWSIQHWKKHQKVILKFFSEISSQLFQTFSSIDELEQCLRIYSNEVMSTPITWMKILGMIVFSGSLALECIAQYNFNFIHSIPHIFSTICIRPHVLEWIVMQGGWVSIGQSYIMVEQKDKMILSKNHPSDIRKEIRFRPDVPAESNTYISNKVNWQF